MSYNLNLLRQTYCRPATVTGKATNCLFPLEKECDQGKAFLAKAPVSLLHLQELDPSGLEQTYRDETTGAELPIFAVFDLEGANQTAFEITTESVPTIADPTSLPAHIPLKKTQEFVKRINERRTKAERAITPISIVLAIFPALAYLFSHVTVTAGATTRGVPGIEWILGIVLAYILSLRLLDRLCPWKKLVITAEFDGILSKEARKLAHAAKDHFDNLYLIVDQQNRWRSAILPDPAPRALDPLLIGELKQDRQRKFFVIHQFDLTEAEQYLAEEFATEPAAAFTCFPTGKIGYDRCGEGQCKR
jgi:hypothetical protein